VLDAGGIESISKSLESELVGNAERVRVRSVGKVAGTRFAGSVDQRGSLNASR